MLDIRTSRPRSNPTQSRSDRQASPARRAIGVVSALEQMRRAPSILGAMRYRADLITATVGAIHDGERVGDVLGPILEAVEDNHDSVTALASIHALARVPGSASREAIGRIILGAEAGRAEHAVWAASHRVADPYLVTLVAGAAMRGGIISLHAQRAMARWAFDDPRAVIATLERLLDEIEADRARAYLVETIGLLPGNAARLLLQRVADDRRESDLVRTTAVAAFAARLEERLPRSFGALSRESGELGEAVRTVRAHRRLRRRGPRRPHDRHRGLRVVQIHLGAVVDADMSRAGMGDTGGVATLLSRLGTEIATQSRVAEVVTIARAPAGRISTATDSTSGHRFEPIPLPAGEGATFTSPWPPLVAAERGIRAALLAMDAPDVVHLRMADPGSLAGATVARELAIPTVFTLAPDPHGPIESAERDGQLDRATFASEDARAALWFRVELVDHLAAQAREIALFPRPRLRRQLQDLVGLDIEAGPPRYTVVPEGVDVRRAHNAAMRIQSGSEPAVLAELESAISKLPPDRHGLPSLVSVGRMHEAKGMARVVEAYLADSRLSSSANLIIVGGDLESPTPGESAELARIETALRRDPTRRRQVTLLGHRPNDDVALVLAAVQRGHGAGIGGGGAYVCGSRKEEFGLAIVEAMAAGLPVVAPRSGGPSSYVEHGITGVLVDTGATSEIANGMRTALELAADPDTAARTRATVQERFTIERMARTLTAVYRVAAGTSTLPLDVDHKAVA